MLIPQDFRGATQFDAAGRFFSYTEHTSPGTVAGARLLVDGQPVGIILPGQSFEVDEDCRRWELVPIDPACTGRVLIGYGRMHTGRVVGPVETETALGRTLAGAEFAVGGFRAPAASTFAALGLIATTRAVSVRSARVIAAGSVGFNAHRTTGGLSSSPTGTRVPVQKLSSGPAATAVMQYVDAASLGGPIPGLALSASFYTSTLQGDQLVSMAPIVLLPGEGLWIIATTAVISHMFAVDFTEL